MQRLAKEVKADENMLRFVVINGLKPEICNHVTRTQPTTWNDLVYHARIGEMSAPETPPLDLTLAVKLEAIQDQLHQLTKVRSVSPVYVAGHSESRCVSSRSDSHPGSPKRVRFDLSLDQGEQEYRYSQDDFRDDHHTRSEERQSFDDWDNEGRSQQQNAGPPNHEFRGRNRFSDSQGRGFSQRQRHSTYGSPQNYGPRNFGQMPYSQPTYGPHQNFGTQNYGHVPTYGPQHFAQQMPNYGPQNFAQPNYTRPVAQPAYTPPPPNMEMGRNAGRGTGFTQMPQCVKCAE